MDFKSIIGEFPDFPKKGILFRDISPLLYNNDSFEKLINELSFLFKEEEIDKIVGIDARGFLLAGAVALRLNKGVVMARKKGKLPGETISANYTIEYGKATLEIQVDKIEENVRYLIVDDLLATGGTANAAAKLIEKNKGKIAGIIFAIELEELKGRNNLKNYNVKSIIKY